MAKKQEETRTSVEELNDSLTRLGSKVQENSKVVTGIVVAIVAVVAIVLIGYYAFYKPNVDAANNAIGQADLQLVLGNDTIALQQYQEVAANYSNAAGNRANLNAAILLYQEKKYEEAIKYLDDFDAKESIIGAAAYSLEGDCYVNLKNYEEALKYFQKAVKASDNNPAYTPAFLMKQATVQRELKNYAAEEKIYQQIVDEYPNYGASVGVDMEKYLERAKLAAQGQEK